MTSHSLTVNDFFESHYCCIPFPGCKMDRAPGSTVMTSVWPGISPPAICDYPLAMPFGWAGCPHSAVHCHSPVSSCQMWTWTLLEFTSSPAHCWTIHLAEARAATVLSIIFASAQSLLANVTKVQDPYTWIPSYYKKYLSNNKHNG